MYMTGSDIYLWIAVISIALYLLYDKYKQMAVNRTLCKSCNTFNSSSVKKCGWCGKPVNIVAQVDTPTVSDETSSTPVDIKPECLKEKAHALIADMTDEQLVKLVSFGEGLIA